MLDVGQGQHAPEEQRELVVLAEEVEVLGASVNVSSNFGSSATTLNASGLSDNFDKWFALADDVLVNASFPMDELERLKARLRISLRQQRTSAGFLMSERFARARRKQLELIRDRKRALLTLPEIEARLRRGDFPG